jgi:hypothetical protein
MDVNATEIDVCTAKPVVCCFYCNDEGHMKKNCCKYQAAQERERGPEKEKPPQKTKVWATTIKEDKEEKETKEGPPAYNPESLMAHIVTISWITCLFRIPRVFKLSSDYSPP